MTKPQLPLENETKALFLVRDLSIEIDGKQILAALNFEIPKGKIGAIIGESGAGKSTLIRLLAGQTKPTAGEIIFKNKKLEGPEFLIKGNLEITRVAQDFELMPHISAAENILQSTFQLLDEERDRLATELLKLFGLEKMANQPTKELSGGEQQRVALAKSLASKTNVLLFDEVFSQLDLATKANVLVQLKQLIKRKNKTALFVLHDPQDAFYLADYVLVLQQGRLVQSGTLEEVYRYSATSKIAGLFGLINKMSAKRAAELFPEIWGQFNRKNQNVWFRPNMAKTADLASDFEVADEFFNGRGYVQMVKVGRTKLWLEV